MEETEPIGKELSRIEESAMFSAQAQFEQAKYWRAVNLILGVPAAVLAAIAGGTALASTTGRVAAGIIALIAAGLSAIATTLNAAQRTEQAPAAGNLYLALRSDARIARETDLPRLSFDGARAALAELRVRQDEINQSSALPARYAYWRAKKNIDVGGQRYEVDYDQRGARVVARSVDEGFREFLRRLTPTDAQRAAGATHRESVKKALSDRLEVSTFFETGSFTHGTGVPNHSDIDALVSLKGGRPGSSYTALGWVKSALEARFPRTPISIRRPAVVVRFGGGYETWEVIPGFMTGRGGPNVYVYDIPSAVTNGGWIDSAPRTHLTYVNDANEKPSKGNAKALARLIKAWKYYCNVPLSSFYLEMRCAEHVKTQTTYVHIWDVWQVLNKLNIHQLAGMNDPMHATGRIYACSSETSEKDALSKLNSATSRARKALDAYRDSKVDEAFRYLDLLFGGQFPAR